MRRSAALASCRQQHRTSETGGLSRNWPGVIGSELAMAADHDGHASKLGGNQRRLVVENRGDGRLTD